MWPYIQDIQKIKFEKGSRDCNKSKKTSSQLEPVRNNYVAIYNEATCFNMTQISYT